MREQGKNKIDLIYVSQQEENRKDLSLQRSIYDGIDFKLQRIK